MQFCSEKTYMKIARFAKAEGDWSQENLTIFGILVAYSQPNMLDEGPDFFWCRPFLKRLFS